MNGWTESIESIERRRARILADFEAFPGNEIDGGLREALTTIGHKTVLLADYQEAMRECDMAVANLAARQAPAPRPRQSLWSAILQAVAR